MQKPVRLCPIALYIGRRFAERRQSLEMTIETVAKQVACSQQTLEKFEDGESELDVLLLLQLEQILCLGYSDYKPPVSYFGFLGMTSDRYAMLHRTRQVVCRIKQHFANADARRGIEDALLKLRYMPLRGARMDMS